MKINFKHKLSSKEIFYWLASIYALGICLSFFSYLISAKKSASLLAIFVFNFLYAIFLLPFSFAFLFRFSLICVAVAMILFWPLIAFFLYKLYKTMEVKYVLIAGLIFLLGSIHWLNAGYALSNQ